ncbi:hypothetical protein ACFXB3_03000 [Streptomyces sp. NPDC059447]|uniref:hypothetical protein n=1 Tax=Streptomyces sp. NPDC059447 TaxID=3346834 RepID=UPI00368B92DA
MAEGTVHALLIRMEKRGLVDVEKVPSEKGPRKDRLHIEGDRAQETLEGLQDPRQGASREPPYGGWGDRDRPRRGDPCRDDRDDAP